jgi:phage terminase large subunit-like protein
MALKSGAKSRNVRPLPPPLPACRWAELVTGEKLYRWQAEVLKDLAVPKRPRVAYVQVPRKSGKTRLAALLALTEACLKPRRHIYAVSDSERNLNSVFFRELRDLIGASEHLRDSLHIFQTSVEVPETGSFIESRANNFKASQGINPHLVIFDEVHLQKSDSIWSGMQMAGAAREDALLFGITTPGYDLTGLAHQLYTAVKAGDPTVYGRLFEAPPGAGLDDRKAWAKANPAYRRRGFRAALEFDRRRLPEHEFRRFRLGQWTATESAWLPYGAWDACRSDRVVEPGEPVWLGFDGSYSGDSTALVGCTEDLHLFVAGLWESPGHDGWRVPRDDVLATVEAAFEAWDVQRLVCDPPYWGRELAEWSARWGDRVLEFSTNSRARMAPACTTFFAAVMDGALTHDGDPRLARHLSNAVVKSSPLGDVITKPDKDSPAKIDAAVAAVMALSEAATEVREGDPVVYAY